MIAPRRERLRPGDSRTDRRLKSIVAATTLLCVGSLVVLALALDKVTGGGETSHPITLWAGAGAAATTSVLASLMLVRAFGTSESRRRTHFWWPLLASFSAATLLALFAELSLRAMAEAAAAGERIGRIDLLPYDWSRVQATNRALLERYRSNDSVLVADDLIGWNVGRSRASSDGLYKTSAEGVRSAERGERLFARNARLRIALLGDSVTFSEEVPFEETWGHRLELELGRDVQVLNFGVSSHGLDQTLLKFERDVRHWNADVTLIGVLPTNPFRNGFVYLPLHPEHMLPFSKPRYVVRDGELRLLNQPIATADSILAAGSVLELPLLEHDASFNSSAWERRRVHASYLARFLLSLSPRWSRHPAEHSTAALIDLTQRLMSKLLREIQDAASAPVVVFLPTPMEVLGGSTDLKDLLLGALTSHGVDVLDPTRCLLQVVPPSELFIAGGLHYTVQGNARLASCLKPAVLSAARSRRGS